MGITNINLVLKKFNGKYFMGIETVPLTGVRKFSQHLLLSRKWWVSSEIPWQIPFIPENVNFLLIVVKIFIINQDRISPRISRVTCLITHGCKFPLNRLLTETQTLGFWSWRCGWKYFHFWKSQKLKKYSKRPCQTL